MAFISMGGTGRVGLRLLVSRGSTSKCWQALVLISLLCLGHVKAQTVYNFRSCGGISAQNWGGGSSFPNEGPEKAADGSTSTKWTNQKSSAPYGLYYNVGAPR